MAQTFADNKMLQQWWNRAISTASFFFIIFMLSDTLMFFFQKFKKMQSQNLNRTNQKNM